MNIKRLSLINNVCICSSALFVLLTLSFHLDVSLVAFPLSAFFLAWYICVSYIKLFKQNKTKYIAAFRELSCYMPFVFLISFVLKRAGNYGTSIVIDYISVILWLVSSVAGSVIQYYISPKRLSKIDSAWGEKTTKAKKYGIRFIAFEIVSWIDSLIQAVFMVMLLHIFIVQLYMIPSESMVPEFLVKDRVVVFKTFSGPKFPLSDVGLPYLKKYNRGDIVVFRNPHYSNDRKSEVKTFVSQLVFMLSGTTVNLNVDDDGNVKADPLVKRITGVEGEQLMMQDGVLYSRTKENDSFKVVEEDSSYACWNLNNVKPSVKQGILQFPISNEEYDSMIECEKLRNEYDLDKAAEYMKNISSQFDELFLRFSSIERTTKIDELTDKEMFEYMLFAQNEQFTLKLLTSLNGSVWFKSFMTDWITKVPDFKDDLYSKANYKLNLMIKECLGNIVIRNTELLLHKISASQWKNDSTRRSYMERAEMLNGYVFLLDRRNMPIFPENDENGNAQYIPYNCYFMMGDNRFNSLDMRHSYNETLRKLTSYDKYSVTYYTNMAPQYVEQKRILGSTCYRFWPAYRKGVPGHTGM